jgi:ADP-heptose:LPS heptosyltransferase
MTIDPSLVSSILLIKMRGIGDVILSTAVARNLRPAFPDARIDFLTEPPSADVVMGSPFLNDVILFDRRKTNGWNLIREVRTRRYTMVIDLFGNPRTALVTRLSGAKVRIGYRFRLRTYAYTTVVQPRGGEVHNVQFNLDALTAIGVAIHDSNPYFPVRPTDESFAEHFFRESGLAGRRVVAISASGGWYTKRWGLDRFSELADRVADRHGAAILVVWGPGEEKEAGAILESMKSKGFLAPKTTLGQLAALFKRCSLMVSTDSGPLHLAATVGTPVLGIYGPTNPMLQGPYGLGHRVVRNESLNCLACNLTECPIQHPCMRDLSVDSVATVAGEMFQNARR